MIIHDRILRLSDAPTLDDRQRRIADWSTMPLLGSQIDRHPLAGTTDEDFAFGMALLISGFEALLREQGTKAEGRRPAARRVSAAKQAAGSGERAAPRRASPPGSAAAAKPAAKSAASKAAPGSQAAGGRTRARRAS
jgi:hypothetical protein